MATRDPVLQWADLARDAGRKWAVDPAVLLGLVHVESGGNRWAVSSAGAQWLTQFIHSTAVKYGVTGDSPRSQLEGAAHYLHDLGYSTDPKAALAKYNAGPAPGFLQRAGAYPANVLAAAKRYGGLSATPATSSPSAASPAPAAAGGQLVSGDQRSGALKALLWVVFVAGGAALSGAGVRKLAGPLPAGGRS